MRQYNSFISVLILVLTILLGMATAAYAGTAEGTLTVDGETTQIKHAYADEYDGDITIVVVDNEIPKEMVPDGVYNLGEQGKVKGIVFVVSAEKKELMSGGLYNLINAIHSHPKWNHLGTVGNGELTITKSEGDTLSGKITTPSENDVKGHKFSYDITFTVSTKKVPLEVTFTGKTDAPSKAYAQWGKALMAGDIEGYKKHSSKEIIEMMPSDTEEVASGIEIQRVLYPTQIDIVNSEIDGDKAQLTMKGSRANESIEGTVTMLKEGGEWKVNKQSWEAKTKQ